jgi:protein O-GlcNAc transferase
MDMFEIPSFNGISRRIAEPGPFSLDGWLAEGETAVTRGLYSEAEDCFKKALRDNPFHPGPHCKLGSLYWSQGKTEDALNSLTRALELDADHREAVLSCANVLSSFNRLEDARLVLEAYVSRHPDDQEALGRLKEVRPDHCAPAPAKCADFFVEQGESQFNKGRVDHARACFEMALEQETDHAAALSNLGIVAWQEGDVKTALDLLYRALDVKPDDPDILYNCSEVLRSVGEWEVAASILQIYLQKGHGSQEDWDVYERLMRLLGTSSWQPQGLSREVAAIYTEMGRALFDAGDAVGSVDACEKAIQIAPDDSGICVQVAETFAAMGMVQEATAIVETALSHAPSSSELSQMLDDLLAKRSLAEEANPESVNAHGLNGSTTIS